MPLHVPTPNKSANASKTSIEHKPQELQKCTVKHNHLSFEASG